MRKQPTQPPAAPPLPPGQILRSEEVTAPDGVTYRRTFVRLTAGQKRHFAAARDGLKNEFDLPPPRRKKNTARKVARQRLEIVLSDRDQALLAAVDAYATTHALPNRGAVMRVALARLVGLEIEIPHHGWSPGRPRKPTPRQRNK